MCRVIFAVSMIIFLGTFSAAAGEMSSNPVADEVIAIVKAQWAAEMKKDTTEAMKNVAEEYTEFNGQYATRLDGKAISVRISEANASASGQSIASEMVNPKVQVYGDVAILSYNFVGIEKDKDGVTTPTRAKSTRIYAKQGGKWMLVHANFGADPNPND